MNAEQRAFACEHLNLARHQAHRFARRTGVPFDELIGPAFEGLCKGAIGFDPSLGWKPSSYLVPKVKGELLHHVRDHGHLLRISHRLKELWMRGRKYRDLGWSDEEIASRCRVELAEWLDCRQACGQPPVSLVEDLIGH